MKHKLLLLGAAMMVLFTMGCANRYYSPDIDDVTQTHKIIAILPPTVSIEVRPKDDPALIAEQEIIEVESIQRALVGWMVARRNQGRLSVDILDLETTNALLEREGYFEGQVLTTQEIATILDVDALVSADFVMSRPISQEVGLAVGLVFNQWLRTNEIQAHIDIKDGTERTVLWSYNRNVGGNAQISTSQLIDNLMRHASHRMPYRTRKRR